MKTVGIGATGLIGVTGTAAAKAHPSNHSWGLTYYDAMEGYDISVFWEWNTNYPGDATRPNDGVGIYWDDDKWEVLNADYGSSKEVFYDSKGVSNGNEKVSWEHDQEEAIEYEMDTKFSATTKISPIDGFDTYPVYAEYHHTWNDKSINGLGIGPNGLFVYWENDGDSWDKAEDQNGIHDN
jgi:hypothetical protein